MKRTVSSWTLAAILVGALGLRLGMGVYLGFDSGPDRAACGADTVEFEHMAWSAAQGNGFTLYEGGPRTAFRAPGYPLLLTVVYRVAGRSYWLNRVVLSLLGSATCWLVYLLARRVGLRRSAALLAAFTTAVLPLQFYWCGHFMSEPLAAFLNVACCLLLTWAIPTGGAMERRPAYRPGPKDDTEVVPPWSYTAGYRVPVALFAAGCVAGLSTLARAASLLVPAVLGGLWLTSRRVPFIKAVWWGSVFAAGMALAIAPWTIRNIVVLDRFALISTNGGSTFWGANNAIVASPGKNWGNWISTSFDQERKQREVLTLVNEVDRDRKEWEIGKEWVRRNPGKLPLLLAGKFYRLLKLFPDSANRPYVLAVALSWAFLLPASLAGIVLLLHDGTMRFRLIPLNAQLLTLLATTAIFYGSERFRAPYEPFLAIYAGAAIAWGMERLNAQCSRERGVR